MSTVEKAAEKLKSLQPESAVLPAVETVVVHSGSTVERLQERARSQDHVAEIAPLWHVDFSAAERAGLLPVDGDANRRLADELRRVKRPLLDNVTGKGTKALAHTERIVVSSAEPGEGKSFTALNLALSLAREPDYEVLLVDGDVPKADLTRVLALEGQPGLMDVLADERCKPADVIVRTDVPNLLVVPAGERHALAAELFGSLRMEYVLEEFGGRNRRRLVVFDSSPLLATSESQALVSLMGQVVVVVAAGRTRRHALSSAMQNLKDSQYVGLILNMSRLPASENHYDRYYGRSSGDNEGEA
ncbi:MAG TPA: AAA family ATPase [Rhodanobacteraceae bacterium]|nr:AAA family ATPase [Rhodanobacteraceae bacterium]